MKVAKEIGVAGHREELELGWLRRPGRALQRWHFKVQKKLVLWGRRDRGYQQAPALRPAGDAGARVSEQCLP